MSYSFIFICIYLILYLLYLYKNLYIYLYLFIKLYSKRYEASYGPDKHKYIYQPICQSESYPICIYIYLLLNLSNSSAMHQVLAMICRSYFSPYLFISVYLSIKLRIYLSISMHLFLSVPFRRLYTLMTLISIYYISIYLSNSIALHKCWVVCQPRLPSVSSLNLYINLYIFYKCIYLSNYLSGLRNRFRCFAWIRIRFSNVC